MVNYLDKPFGKKNMKTIKENDIIYSCPFCKKEHILNLDETVKKVKEDVLELITCCCRHCEELKERITG